MLNRRYVKKIIKLLATSTVMIVPASSVTIVSQIAVNNASSSVGAISTQSFENAQLVDQLHFCSSLYMSNEDGTDPTRLTVTFETTGYKITKLEWRNASITIPTVDANFQAILDWANTYRAPPAPSKWTFKDASVFKDFFDGATINRAHWAGKLTWPGFDIPSGIFNSYYLFDKLFNWDSVAIQNGCLAVGADAFKGIQTLHDVWFPSTITQIGDSAFAWTGVQVCNLIGGQLNRIDDYAFYQCSQLSNIMIKTVSNTGLSIGNHCFRYDGNLANTPAIARNITVYAQNISELKNACFKFTNTPSSIQSLNSFTFGYLGALSAISKGSTSPWSDTTAMDIYVPNIYDSQPTVLNNWDGFFPTTPTIIPIDGLDLSFPSSYNDEILFDYANGTTVAQPIIMARSSPDGYATPLDISKISIDLYGCSNMNPAKSIDTESIISGVNFGISASTDGTVEFNINIGANVSYFDPTPGSMVSRGAWIVIKYDNKFTKYRLCYFYNQSIQRADSTSKVQPFVNGTPISSSDTINVDMNTLVDDKIFNINTGWNTGANNAPTISSNDTLTIDSSIFEYPNIQYDSQQKRIDFYRFCLPGTFTFTFTVSTMSSSTTITQNFSLTFVVTKMPIFIDIHNNNNKFISGSLPVGSYDEIPGIYYVTSIPSRCNTNADWELIPNGSEPNPPGLYIKLNAQESKPSNFPGSSVNWTNISAGQLWTNHGEMTGGYYTFKVKATINNPNGTPVTNTTPAQEIYFVDSDVHNTGIIDIDKGSFGGGNVGEATVSQRTQTILNVGFTFASNEYNYSMLQPYARLYDRNGLFPQGITVVKDDSDPIYPYKINANITSAPGDYYVTIGGRSSNFYFIAVREYTFILHVLPQLTAKIAFPTTLIILFIVTGLFIVFVGYNLFRKYISKR